MFVRAWPIISAYSLSDSALWQVWQPSAGKFGFWPFIVGTVWVTIVGIILSVPPCLLVSIYLAEYAHSTTRSIAKPVLDLLAAIPPVVYGVWGLLAIVPFVDEVLAPLSDRWLGSISIFAVNQPTGFGILAAGIVLAVMIAPLIISVIYEVFATVPNDLTTGIACCRRNPMADHSQCCLSAGQAGDHRRGCARCLPRPGRDHRRVDGGGQCRQGAHLHF